MTYIGNLVYIPYSPEYMDAANDILDQNYIEACSYLGKDILSASFLKSKLRYFFSHQREFSQCPARSRFYSVVYPQTENQVNFTAAQVAEGNYCTLKFEDGDALKNQDRQKQSDLVVLLENERSIPSSVSEQCSFDFDFSNGFDISLFNCAYVATFNRLRGCLGLDPLDLNLIGLSQYAA